MSMSGTDIYGAASTKIPSNAKRKKKKGVWYADKL